MSGAGSERPTKRLRRLSSEYDDSEATDDWMPVKDRPNDRRKDMANAVDVGRSRRSQREQHTSAATTGPASAAGDAGAKSIRLTVKAPAGGSRESAGSKTARDTFEPGEVVTGPRGTRAKRTIVEESESEDVEESEEEGDEEDEGDENEEEAEGEEEEEEDEEGEDEDEDEEEEEEDEDEDVDAEGESDVDDVPDINVSKAAAPSAKATAAKSKDPPALAAPTAKGKARRVEERETSVDDDDRDLSALDSEGNHISDKEEDEEADAAEDAEGQLEEAEEGEEGTGEEDEDEEEEDDDEDDATPATGSRASTPDLSKMTKRQRSRLEAISGELLQLPSETKAKKILSAEEHAMRRAEMARRRKNLSEKRKEEEKMDTINKLLKKQAPKTRRTRADGGGAGGDATPKDQEAPVEKAKDIFVRWVSSSNGIRVGVPEEWLGTPVGRVFEVEHSGERMVKKVEANA